MDILFDPLGIQLPAQTGAGKGLQLKARLGYQLLLHVALGPDKQDLAVRIPPPHLIGHGNGWIDMSGGTAAGKYQIQFCFPPDDKRLETSPLSFCRDILNTMPISPRFTARAVPP